MAIYDSAKTRAVATKVNRIAYGMDGEVRTGLRTAAVNCEAFKGRTAEAMAEKLEMLLKTASGIEEELRDLAHRINAYADKLELADEQLAEKL